MAKYTGRYKDLIPAGYKFRKFYARNYRANEFEHDINDSMTIWQKGGDIEILDFYSKSGWVINCIIKNRATVLTTLEEDRYFSIRMNTKTGQIWPYNRAEQIYVAKIEHNLYNRIDKYGKVALDLYYKKWKKAHIPKTIVMEVIRLFDMGVVDMIPG